jgi:hypothetical protein
MESSCNHRYQKVIDRISAIAYVCKASLRLTGSTSANNLSAADLLFTLASSILCMAEAYSMNLSSRRVVQIGNISTASNYLIVSASH